MALRRIIIVLLLVAVIMFIAACTDIKTDATVAPTLVPSPTSAPPASVRRVDGVTSYCYNDSRVYITATYPILIVHNSIECGSHGPSTIEWP